MDKTAVTGSAEQGSTMPPGSLLSHTYRIDALLARGGMGEVYKAHHVELGTAHAIKIILPELANNPKVVGLFRREASVLRQVRHPAVVAYDGVFRDENGRVYLVMEFVDGPSLHDLLRQGPLPVAAVRGLRDRVALGLADAHRQGVIHRDLSPSNIILPGCDITEAKIIDFGIAKVQDPDAATIIGKDFAGRYSYASPEQVGMFGGTVDARSDIYSLGLVLVAAARGTPLDMGNTLMSVIRTRETVPDLDGVPDDLRDELGRMLRPDPDDRPPSMEALLVPATPVPETSLPADDTVFTPTAGEADVDAPRAAGSGRRIGVAVAALVVLALAGVSAWQFWPTLDPVRTTPDGTAGGAPAGLSPDAPASPGPPPLQPLDLADTAEPADVPAPPAADRPANPIDVDIDAGVEPNRTAIDTAEASRPGEPAEMRPTEAADAVPAPAPAVDLPDVTGDDAGRPETDDAETDDAETGDAETGHAEAADGGPALVHVGAEATADNDDDNRSDAEAAALEVEEQPVDAGSAPATLGPADRRLVQGHLVRLGHYAGAIDGVFGAGTRTAIGRFQTTIGAPATGTLTVRQVARLADLAAVAAEPDPAPRTTATPETTGPADPAPPATAPRGADAGSAFSQDLLDRFTGPRRVGATTSENLGGWVSTLNRTILPCWQQQARTVSGGVGSVAMVVTLAADGTVQTAAAANPALVEGDPAYRLMVEAVSRAMTDSRCQPIPLPAEEYPGWQTLRFRFTAG